jgi:hypothetical protein
MTFNSDDNGDSGRRGAHSAPDSMIGAGIAIGAGAGVALGLAFGNLALGIAIGTAIGVALGAAMQQDRVSTTAGTRAAGTRPLWIAVTAGLLILGAALATLIVLMVR